MRVMTLRLTPKLTLIFVLFAAGLLIVVNLLAYNSGRTALEAAATAELESTAGEKVAALTAWVEEKKSDLEALADDPDVIEQAAHLLAVPSKSAEAIDIHDRLIEQFMPRILSHEFLVAILLDPQTGQVLAATNSSEEGKPRADRPYFLEGKKGTYLMPVYFSQELQAPAITVSAPVFSEEGRLVGVLAGRVDLDELNAIIQRRTALHRTDDSFLVNISGQFITQPRFLPEPAILQRGITSMPVERCLHRRNGTVFATDYRDEPVIAVYRWSPETQMCLIVKISQAEALASAHSFAIRIGWIGLFALLIASLVAVALSHTIIRPIVAMQTAAQRYGRGDLTVRLPETRGDELGMLAREFNTMAASLAEKDARLQGHSFDLEKQVQERMLDLQQSEERFRLLAETSPNALVMVSSAGRISFINQTAISMFGYPRQELIGYALELLVPERFRAEHPSHRKSYFGNPSSRLMGVGRKLFALCKDGSEIPVEIGLSPIETPEGLFTLATITDITERQRAEEILRESEDRYRDIVEHIHDLIGTHDLEGNILSINPAAVELLGFDMDTLLKMNMRDVLAPEVRDQFDDYLVTIQRDGQASGLMLAQTKTGEKRIWQYDNTLRKDSSKGPIIRAMARDITEHKRAEESLQEKERLLSEAQHIGQIGSLSYDVQKDAFQFSDEMYHLLDIPAEKFQHNSKGFMALVYPSDRLQVAGWITDLKAGWQIKALDFRIFRQNGELRYLHCKGAVEFNSKGESTRFIGTMQDMTERRLAEIQINQQIRHLTALSEIDRAIISGLDQRRTFDVILSQTILQLQVDAADILLLDSDGETLSFAAGQGFRTQTIEISHVPMGESYAGRAAGERRLIQVPYLKDRPLPPHLATLIADEGFISYIALPLIVKGKVKGVLEVFHHVPLQTYPEWLDFLNMLAGQAAIAVENANLVENLQQSNRDLTEAYDAAIEGWSHAMDLRDRETDGHTGRVTELTLKLARAMGIEEEKLIDIRRGALLHDIGKLAIPDHILFKPGKLTPEEWDIMQKHPEFAYEMLSPIRYLKPALPIPYFHHEKWDGSGYPLGLRGEQIPLEARVFAVIDVWDALLSDRPYRKAWTVERTLEYIRSLAGSHFDPRVVECFLVVVKADT